MFVVTLGPAHFMVNGVPISMKRKVLSENTDKWTVRDREKFRISWTVYRQDMEYVCRWLSRRATMKPSVGNKVYMIVIFCSKKSEALFMSDMNFIQRKDHPCKFSECDNATRNTGEVYEFDPDTHGVAGNAGEVYEFDPDTHEAAGSTDDDDEIDPDTYDVGGDEIDVEEPDWM